MEIDIFKDILVPVIGGLGIFMLGLEFMANGIQALSVNTMRNFLAKAAGNFLAKAAGTPIKGVLAGTLITGYVPITPELAGQIETYWAESFGQLNN